MLANLVPGFRDIRTPILVGALWGAVLWILTRWHFNGELKSIEHFLNNSDVLRWNDHPLLGVIGSFAAYVAGVATTLDPERGVTGWLIAKIDGRRSAAKAFESQSSGLIDEARERLARANDRANKRDKFDAQSTAAKYSDYGTLKVRLLTKSEDLFLACDKLDAEATLRMSSAIPLLVGSISWWVLLDENLFAIGIVLSVSLFLRGIGRAFEARDSARDAVVAKVVPHPLEDLIASFPFDEAPDNLGNRDGRSSARTTTKSGKDHGQSADKEKNSEGVS